MFSRVLVANRGEIAVRVIRALHELGVEAVAVYSTADEDALHVRLADRAVRIGPPAAAQSYLSIPAIIAAAKTTACDAVHPGYGFLSENDEFVLACEDNDLVFIGPPADVMARMGDKAQAKAEMRSAGVPLVPGAEGTSTAAEARGRGRRARLSRPAEGRSRWRRARHAPRQRRRRGRGRVRAGVERGARGVLRRQPLRREGDLPCTPRRDPGALRRPRRRADLRRARVLDPAAAPEADRGVAVARARRRAPRGDGGRRRARMPPHRLPQRRHVRVPRRPRRLVLVHRAERAPPGRASSHRARHRARPRARAGAHRGGRAAADHGTRAALGPRDRDPHQRRGPVARLHAGARHGSSASGRRSAPASGSTRSSRRALSSRRTTTR